MKSISLFVILFSVLLIGILSGCSNDQDLSESQDSSAIVLSSAPENSVGSKTLVTHFSADSGFGQYEITFDKVVDNAVSPNGSDAPEGKKWVMATVTVHVLSQFATVVESDFSINTSDGRVFPDERSDFVSLPEGKQESKDLSFLVDADVNLSDATLHYAEFASEDYTTMEWSLWQ